MTKKMGIVNNDKINKSNFLTTHVPLIGKFKVVYSLFPDTVGNYMSVTYVIVTSNTLTVWRATNYFNNHFCFWISLK